MQPATLERRISVAYLIGRDTYPEYRKKDPYPGPVALRISLNPVGVEKNAPELFLPVDAEGRRLIKLASCLLHPSLTASPGPCATFLGIQPPVKSALDKAGLETLCRNMEKQQKTRIAMKASKSESDPTGRSWFVPSRLLKLEPETGHGNLRLVSKQEISKKEQKEVRYAALSYCWGSASHAATQTVTKRTTLGQRQRGISDSELTAVIRDTVKVCRVIGLHYLWVDALCIIQGDRADWEAESATMAQIYGSAYVTICSLMSSNCHEGFLNRHRQFDESVQVPFTSSLDPNIKGSFTIRPPLFNGLCSTNEGDFPTQNPYSAHMALRHSTWIQRGWTFQELKMSNMLLCFSHLRTHLISSGKVFTDTGGANSQENARYNREIAPNPFQPPDPLFSLYSEWMQLVEDYSDRLFTARGDVFYALAGLALSFSQALGDTYQAGLWQGNLCYGLLWEMSDAELLRYEYRPHSKSLPSLLGYLKDTKTCHGPSWSWASRPAKVTYYHCKDLNKDQFHQEVLSLDSRTTVRGLNPFGKVSGGIIRLQTKVAHLELGAETKRPDSSRRPGTESREFRTKGCILGCVFDCFVDDATLRSAEILLVLIGRTTHWSKNALGLIVCPSLSTASFGQLLCRKKGLRWVRIGVFSVRAEPNSDDDPRRFFEKCEIKSLTLV
jgi:hypothetical protein